MVARWSSSSRAAVALLTLTALAFALRVANLGGQSLWYDEGFSVFLARQSIPDIIRLTAGDIHPPLYYALLHGWIALAGDTEFSLRYLSLIPSVLLAPVAAALARAAVGHHRAGATGVVAAGVVAVSPAGVWYGQETRMYALLALAVALSLVALLRLLRDRAGWWWALWIGAGVVGAYTHFYALVVVAAQAVVLVGWIGLTRPPWRRGAALLGGVAAVAVAYLPWLGPATTRLDADQSYFEGTLDLAAAARDTVPTLIVGHTLEGPIALLGTIVTIGLAGAGVWALRRRPVAAAVLVATVLIPALLIAAISWTRPKYHPRYLFHTLPAAHVLVAVGLVAAWRAPRARPLAGLAVVGVAAPIALSLANLFSDPRFARDDWRSVAATIRADARPDDAVALIAGHAYPVLAYYYHGPVTRLPDDVTLSTTNTLGYTLAHTLNELAAGSRRVWVARWQDEVVDPNGYLARLLADGADRDPLPAVSHGARLERYTFRPGAVFTANPTIRDPLAIDFGGMVRLLGYDSPMDGGLRVPAGGAITLTYYWQAQKPLTADYKVALRLIDAQGAVWGRVDRRPAAYAYLTTRWKPGEIVYGDVPIPLGAATPPGTYRLEVEVYAEQGQTIVPLNVLNRLGAPIGQAAVVGELVVTAPVAPQPPVDPPRRLTATIGGLALVGVDQPTQLAAQRPGGVFDVGLYWTALRPADAAPGAARFALRFGDRVIPVGDGAVAPATYPVAQWQPGAVWRAISRLRVPVEAPAGVADLVLLPERGDPVVIGQVTVLAIDRGQRLPDVIANPLRTPVGGFGVLRGWDVDRAEVRAGETARVTLYWEALGPSAQDLKVFVHLLDGAGRVVAQRDAPPRDGAAPTHTWFAGQTFIDAYPIALPRDVPAGDLTIEVGMYDPGTNQRVRIGDNDHLVLGVIRSR